MNFIGNYVLLYKKEERENLAVYVNKHWYIMKRTDPDRTTEERQTDGQKEIPGPLQTDGQREIQGPLQTDRQKERPGTLQT